MTDEIFDRQYQAGRDELNAAIFGLGRRFAASIGNAFAVLNRIEYIRRHGRRQRNTCVRSDLSFPRSPLIWGRVVRGGVFRVRSVVYRARR